MIIPVEAEARLRQNRSSRSDIRTRNEALLRCGWTPLSTTSGDASVLLTKAALPLRAIHPSAGWNLGISLDP